MIRVSVIIPIFNVSSFIERCAHSLMQQTMREGIEFLFIDDCTPDDSILKLQQVLGEYPYRRDQVRIIRMERNSGQAAVHAFGVEQAEGEYVIRCDSDDYVEPEMYETMLKCANETDADMINCGIYYHYPEQCKISIGADFNCSGKTILRNLMKSSGPYCCLWNKLIRRSILVENNIIPYPGINVGEDMGLVYRALYFCEKVVSVPKAFYHYDCTRTSSISHESVLRRWNDVKFVLTKLSEFYEGQHDAEEYRLSMHAFQFEQKTDYLLANNYYNLWQSEFPNSNTHILNYTIIPLCTRLLYWCSFSKIAFIRNLVYCRLIK